MIQGRVELGLPRRVLAEARSSAFRCLHQEKAFPCQPVFQRGDVFGVARLHHTMYGDCCDVVLGEGTVVVSDAEGVVSSRGGDDAAFFLFGGKQQQRVAHAAFLETAGVL